MVDVSDKASSAREAVAAGRVLVSPQVVELLRGEGVPKGDALAVARVAGIMGAKRTPDLVPLCHPIAITGVTVDLTVAGRRRRHHRDGPDHRPHRRRDGGADRGGGRRPRPGRHGQGRGPGARSSPTYACCASPADAAAPGSGTRTDRAQRTVGPRAVGLQPGRGRGVRGHDRSEDRQGPGGDGLRRRFMPRWSPTGSRYAAPCAQPSPPSVDLVVTTGRHRHHADRRDAGDDPGGHRPGRSRASPRRSARTAWPRGSRPPRCREGVAGQAGRTLIVNLPGLRRRRARTGWRCSLPILEHALDQMRGSDHARPDDRGRTLTRGWPVRLSAGPVALRPLKRRDAARWAQLRRRNLAWLSEWEATQPPQAGSISASYRSMTRDLIRQGRQGKALPFALTYHDEMVGQVTVTGITWGSARWAQVGYWIDESHAGKGIMPVAVALACDHCLTHDGSAPDRDRDPAGEPGQPARRREAGLRPGGHGSALPAHQRAVARPSALRDHRGGRRRAGCWPASTRPPA